MPRPVVVVASNRALRQALVAHIGLLDGLQVLPADAYDDAPAGAVLVTPAPELPVLQSLELTRRGLRVVVLATFPSPAHRAAYVADGAAAAYVPMLAGTAELSQAVLALAEGDAVSAAIAPATAPAAGRRPPPSAPHA